ncbi:hypothetical protein [Bacteroides sp.]|uniref:hypothetical protein n=1 Tax=Bacteroides sp. TaxID=29523 RepID=UPI002608616F|nr:hypothetical protein [Bacteroides sp.]MDD3037906.1 hypothetical protein [Bacteroides sp.]
MSTDYCASSSELFADIVRIYPFKFGEIKHVVPFNVRKETVTVAELGVTEMNKLLEGRQCYSTSILLGENDKLMSIDLDAGATYEDSTETSVIGISHKVVLDFKVLDPLIRCIQPLTDLELATAQDFIIMTSDDQYLLIRCPEYAYKCTVKKGPELKQASIEIKNINGVQIITV